MTDDSDLQPFVAAEFASLADLLQDATPAQWDTPSLCDGWRVREVVAHVTMPARYSEQEFMAELQRCGFDFTRLSNEMAARDAGLPATELVASLRSEIMQHWKPPGGGYHRALTHVVIHGLDATVPLGVRHPPDEALRVVLHHLTSDGDSARFGVSIEDRCLRATDLDWSYGSGAPLNAAAADLALAMCGRVVPAQRLAGGQLRRAQPANG
jgi:uncharacterized protein (TIGR03083 family)